MTAQTQQYEVLKEDKKILLIFFSDQKPSSFGRIWSKNGKDRTIFLKFSLIVIDSEWFKTLFYIKNLEFEKTLMTFFEDIALFEKIGIIGRNEWLLQNICPKFLGS